MFDRHSYAYLRISMINNRINLSDLF